MMTGCNENVSASDGVPDPNDPPLEIPDLPDREIEPDLPPETNPTEEPEFLPEETPEIPPDIAPDIEPPSEF